MTTASERIPVLVTKTQKQQLTAKAKAAGLSTGEFLRRAGESYSASEDQDLLEGLLDQVIKITAKTEQAIDNALDFVAASEQRLALFDAKDK
ncbi:MAG: hypothetical protein IPN42_06090 [Methylococcaceae bacterium]|nr:hypothetical protein [Methylococcaceae bacterium]